MTAQLITLPEWIALHYAAASAPSLGTVRKWAKAGQITPAPVKHGKTYYVSPSAVYGQSRAEQQQVRGWKPDYSVLSNM